MDIRCSFEGLSAMVQDIEDSVLNGMKSVGEEAVEYAKQNGNYQNRTGLLRRSNKYKADNSGLLLYNDAPYAEDVEKKGYDVLSGAALFAEKRLKEEFGK